VSDQIAKRFYVSGTVQGVGYRFFAQRVASKLGVRGYVKNLFDGRVEVYAIGTPEKQKAFRDELRKGPSFANVNEVAEVEAEILEAFAGGFSIEHED
jgi:acylphosphatase